MHSVRVLVELLADLPKMFEKVFASYVREKSALHLKSCDTLLVHRHRTSNAS